MSNADALLSELIKGLPVAPNQMTQLGMDGPNTNWRVLKKMVEYTEKEELCPLEDIGSCWLHVISGTLQTGVKAVEWGTEKVIRAMFK